MYKNFVRSILNDVGPGFCLAKWTTSTMHLAMGKNHSCHHPSPHVIPITEIKKSPLALHNSEHKKQQRKTMLEGGRPEECSYCWNVEDHSFNHSDRIVTSSKLDYIRDYNHIKNSSWQDPAKLRMLEVSFSNVCNLACAYCGPQYSSKWYGEIKSKGSYVESGNYNEINFKQYQDKEENPYIKAFWKYLPTVYNDLKTIRITGGEPLLSRHTDTLLDYIVQHPNKQMEIVVNTNLSVDQDILDKFIDKIKQVKSSVRRIKVATSCEAYGNKAEYIRDGLIYKKWIENCRKVLETKFIKLQIMSSYNVFAVTSFSKFLYDVANLKKQYKNVTLSVSYVRYPNFMSAHVLPVSYLNYLEESLRIIKKHFQKDSESRFMQVISYFTNSERHTQDLVYFKNFIKEYDARRNKKFEEVFPEYKDL
jgi:organic radical activating enzyme